MTGGTTNTPAPAITATVPTTGHSRPTHRGIRKRRSSWSVMAEKYTAASAARKTRMRTSATRRTNQMTRAATKSATNVAPGDPAGDDSTLSGTARRRRPGPARLPLRPSRAAWPRPESPRGAAPASASAPAAAGPCRPAFQRLELLHQRVSGEILVHLGCGDELALLVLDLLGHPLERLEHAPVADRGHRLLDPLVRFGALGARDQDVLLALRVLDSIVELAQRQLQLLRLFPVLDPRLVQLHGRLRVLVVTHQRLLRQVVAPLLHRQHRALLPIPGARLLLVDLGRQPLLVRDRARHLLLGLRQLTPHIHDQLGQHLLP